jgi:hypothetical protein
MANDRKPPKNSETESDPSEFEESDFAHSGSDGRGGIGDTIKKLFAVGTAAAFLTEEGIRQALGDIKLPKDVLNLLLSGANKSKEELMSRVGNEVVKLVSKLDIVKEGSKFLETHKFKISAEVEILKKEEKP